MRAALLGAVHAPQAHAQPPGVDHSLHPLPHARPCPPLHPARPQRGSHQARSRRSQVVNYPPVTCKDCGAAVNPYAHVDYNTKMWVCPHCTTRNYFPQYYSDISPEHMPSELFPECTTIEYMLPTQTQYPPIYIFIIDTAVSEDELEACKSTLKQALQMMPENCLIGLITFGTHVHVHELQHAAMSKVFVFRGTGEFTPASIAAQLGFRAVARSQQQAPQPGQPRPLEGVLATNFLVALEDGEYEISNALDQLQTDAYPPASDHRKSRCTGTAVQVAAGFAAAGLPDGVCAVRLMLFVGGPCTEGARAPACYARLPALACSTNAASQLLCIGACRLQGRQLRCALAHHCVMPRLQCKMLVTHVYNGCSDQAS
jgi:Sec23/Sec24 trunk domain/Sec23/Sec24 zinc finger